MKKRCLFPILLSALLVITLSAFAGTNGHTREEAVKWAYGNIGKDVNYDGYSGPDGTWPAQCVDLTFGYYQYLGQWVTGDAKTYANNALPKGWQRVYNSPEPGDVGVSTSGTYGHVGIVVSVSDGSCSTVEYNTYGGTYDNATGSWSERYPGSECTRANGYWACFIRPDFPQPLLPGDADTDGRVGVSDLLAIISNIVSGTPVDSFTNGDINGSGTLDLVDLQRIIDKLVN